MTNETAAKIFIEAIQRIANKPDNLNNFELYLARHFDKWLEEWVNTPEKMAAEMEHFASMEITG